MKKIEDQEILEEIARTATDWELRSEAVERLEDQIAIGMSAFDVEAAVRRSAVKSLDDQDVLEKKAASDENDGVRLEAVKRVSDEALLAELAKTASYLVREAAMEKLEDPKLLAEVALAWETDGVTGGWDRDHACSRVLNRIDDPKVLAEVLTKSSWSPASKAATLKLDKPWLLGKGGLLEIPKWPGIFRSGFRPEAKDPRVVQPLLMEVTSVSFYARPSDEIALHILEELAEELGPEMDEVQLRSVLTLPDDLFKECKAPEDYGGGTDKWTLDCRWVKKLARKELAERGLE